MLYDNHNRPITYVRLAVTDRCNLRCFYCMPEEGIKYLPKQALLTYEEIERLIKLLASMGVSKVRLTGGEPFVRNDLMELMSRIVETPGIKDVHLTTNGVLTAPHIPAMKKMGIASVNLSLDTLDKGRFHTITRRDEFDAVMNTYHQLIAHGIPTKINTVVMEGKNIEDIIPLVELTKNHPVDVRFIEEMPFNGEGTHYPVLTWTHKKILEYIQWHYPTLDKLKDAAHSTSYNYAVPGHKGTVGIIAAFSRTFCGTCNRIRVTAQGTLKTCLYDDGVLDIRKMMRDGCTDDELRSALSRAFNQRPADGFEAESNRKNHRPAHESMSTIGG
ncbi:GTP 3',8-cyclase MoaA [Pseudochryseolinea flava]|uniref:GTP 3',8-cyclase n=1 Tax=Pseudochryseolinea flava TaxID=2059302 RepID=A0A364Y358_9BACT|nr:GTP 3',8-cyclase MoaA [Pseudochryseolinea flava]RAW01129.1 GTP 3',8-cyclase MoaA [Pseudochryseolinea flava]